MPAASTELKETAVLPEAAAVGTKPDEQSAAVNEADNLPAAVGEAVADDASDQGQPRKQVRHQAQRANRPYQSQSGRRGATIWMKRRCCNQHCEQTFAENDLIRK